MPAAGRRRPAEGFDIAVFANRWPAFAPPRGAAEVVVYTEDHEGSFAGLEPDRAERGSCGCGASATPSLARSRTSTT